jgi:hypothetical protein
MKTKIVCIVTFLLLVLTALNIVIAINTVNPIQLNGQDDTEKSKRYTPEARYGHSMVYDTEHNVFILFGGKNMAGESLDDTWAYNYRDNKWRNMNPSNKPSPRSFHSMSFDSNYGIVILFGGEAEDGYNDETWEYDYSTNTWSKIFIIDRRHPSARKEHAMNYDDTHKITVLFGGITEDSEYSKETWYYYPSSQEWYWVWYAYPSARFGHSIANLINGNSMILFGGYSSDGGLNDTWRFDTENYWNLTSPQISPSERFGHAMEGDSVNKKFLLFGGQVEGSHNNETWIFDPNSNEWLEKYPSVSPSARSYHSLTYDSSDEVSILFGGVYEGGVSDELWFYDYYKNTWIELHPKSKSCPEFRKDILFKIDLLFESFFTDWKEMMKLLMMI